jgi:ComF family protein
MLTVLPRVAKLKRAALDLLFPQWCIGCGKEGSYICGSCRHSLETIFPPVCPRCGRPQPGTASAAECSNCAGRLTSIRSVNAPFLFTGVIRDAIHEFKYRNLRALGPELAQLLFEYFRLNPVPGDVFVPVPLHPKRFKERGYNQSAVLARELGRLTGLPVIGDCLIRTKFISSQARSAGVSERQNNVTGAFARRDGRLAGRQVILIDDVSTSGATLESCAGTLMAAGAAAVRGLVIALEL